MKTNTLPPDVTQMLRRDFGPTPRTDAMIASDTFGPSRAANVADGLAALARTLEREAAQSLEATRLLTQQVTDQAATIATLRAALGALAAYVDISTINNSNRTTAASPRWDELLYQARAALAKVQE